MALGCIPSHMSYFSAYESLKIYFDVDNDDFNIKDTLCIGFATTFFHDFFITPADGKCLSRFNLFSCQVETVVVLGAVC